MPSIRQSIRSSTASKRPTSAIADGQIALNTASGTPGMFFKDSAGNIVKTGPAHYGASAPNSSPAVGGSTGNSIGEAWLDVSLTPAGWKIWNGSAWVNATPLSSDTVQGLVELATNAETQAGVDTARAVTAASLQSKVSDSISTTSASGIASSTAVKTAYDLANAALPKSGGIVTGNLEIGSTGSFTFEGSTADGFETTLDVVDPTADRTITFPNTTGTVVTTGDTGTVTSTMILDGTILNADINASAAIAFSKLATLSSANILVGSSTGVPTSRSMSGDITIGNTGVTAIAAGVIVNADISSAAAIAYSKLALSSGITNTDVSASAAIVDTKLATIATALKVSNSATTAASANTASAIVARDASGNFTAGTITAALTGAASSNVLKAGDTMTGVLAVTAGTAAAPSIAFEGDSNTGIYSPGADQVAISTNGTEKLIVKSDGKVGLGTSGPTAPLHLVSASSDPVLIKTTGSSTYNSLILENDTGSKVAVGIGGSTVGGSVQDAGYVGTISNKSFYINTNNTQRVTVTATGLVGIGTTSPNAALDVVGNIELGTKGASNSTIFLDMTSDTTYTDYGFRIIRGGAANGNTQLISRGTGALELSCFDGGFLGFSTSNAERARIDSSGRLLVGTSTARGLFFAGGASALTQIEGNSTSTASLSITRNDATADGNALILAKARSTAYAILQYVDGTTSDDRIGRISFQGADGTNMVPAASIEAYVDGTPGANDMPGRLVFSTTADGASSPTERMRITQDGKILAGTTDNTLSQYYFRSGFNGDHFHVWSDNASFTGSTQMLSASRNTTNSTYNFLACVRQGNAFSLFIRDSGNVQNANNSYTAISDVKLKENIVDATSQWDDIKALRVRKYKFKEETGHSTHVQIGLIAQEVEPICPGLVDEAPDRDFAGHELGTVTKGVNYSVLYMKAVKALQEAMERIEALESDVAALKGA
jgi:hypothetical protein